MAEAEELEKEAAEAEVAAPEATSYRPDKNGFSKKENTKYTGRADNIYTF